MSKKIPASEYMGYDKYIGDEYIIKKNPNMIEIPENATNGDAIKAMFKGRDLSIITERLEHTHWWNVPYKR